MNVEEEKAGLAPTPGYRFAKMVGKQLYVAGQVPLDQKGELVGITDPSAQTRQCLDNLRRVLFCHQFQEDDIVQLKLYVVGPQPNLDAAWNAVRNHFKGKVPPSTLLGVSLLGYQNQLVEIDATVVKSSS